MLTFKMFGTTMLTIDVWGPEALLICIIKRKYVVSDNPMKHPQSVSVFALIYIA